MVRSGLLSQVPSKQDTYPSKFRNNWRPPKNVYGDTWVTNRRNKRKLSIRKVSGYDTYLHSPNENRKVLLGKVEDPEFGSFHIDLGVQYIELGKPGSCL